MFNRLRGWFLHKDLKRQHLAAFSILVGSAAGLLASFVLSIEALVLAKNAQTVLSCDLNSVLSCSVVANHWSAVIFGFPNSFIGMMTLPVMVTIAVALLAGVKFPRWFMRSAQVGAVVGMIFALWMFAMSYGVIGVLCPWCLTLDAGMILIFFGITRYNVLLNNISWRGAHRFISGGYDALVMVSLTVAATVAIIAKFGEQLF